jgi:hypothetical protein
MSHSAVRFVASRGPMELKRMRQTIGPFSIPFRHRGRSRSRAIASPEWRKSRRGNVCLCPGDPIRTAAQGFSVPCGAQSPREREISPYRNLARARLFRGHR